MTTPACEPFRAELADALARGDAERLAGHEHVLRCAVCRARLEEELALERLLEAGATVVPAAALGARVLAGLADERAEARLDALLGSVLEPVAPADLAPRVLAALAPERPRDRRPRAFPRRAWLAAAAALVLFAAGAWLLRRRGATSPPVPGPAVASVDEPEPELLEALDALEDWEVVTSDDLDLMLAGLDPLDSTLLELGADTGG